MQIGSEALQTLASTIFAAIGCDGDEAGTVARFLVKANLSGHDSHGVVRIPRYIEYWRMGAVLPNRRAEAVWQNDAIALFDGNKGFGQTIGGQVMAAGIEMAARQGLAMVGLKNVGHLGRIGDWAEQAAAAGQASIHFVNTTGRGNRVAPYGGSDRRLSTNPIAIGMPMGGREPLIFDAATSVLAEGKILVARNKGVELPDGVLLDSAGQPTNDPNTLYADPGGAILAMGGHKGSGLAVMADLLAGVMAGGGCTRPGMDMLENGMLSILMDPALFADMGFFAGETARFADWVQASPPIEEGGEVLLPGDIERRNQLEREADGIPLDDTTWQQILETARAVDVAEAALDGLPG
ncbi:MAG: malate/lactate/ureidoglycolate dehydrogenase [Alphaproteobacteria bacterium]|jgi:uncharacterized oxidoreductase|nr:malate/lactate/ureidoglycolate dehydrogenase [Alphaproteobacteria bacterium]